MPIWNFHHGVGISTQDVLEWTGRISTASSVENLEKWLLQLVGVAFESEGIPHFLDSGVSIV
jgi:hypothetical protein